MIETLRSTGPILKRELVGLLRTRKAFWITVLTVAGASLVPLTVWPEPDDALAYQGSIQTFKAYCRYLALALFVFVPVVSASAISGERERDTYEMLYSTRISPAGIVLGKLIAAVGFFLLLFAFTLPVVTLLGLLGGFQGGDFVLLALKGASFTLALGVAGLWASVHSERTYKATFLAFVAILGFGFAMGIVSVVFLAPLVLMFETPGMDYELWSFLAICAPPEVLVPILLLSTVRRARHPGHTPSVFLAETPTLRTERSASPRVIPDGANPVFIATIRNGPLGAFVSRGTIFWGTSFVLFLSCIAFQEASQWEGLGISPSSMHVILYSLALILPGTTAAGLASELEQRRLDLLRSTLLSPSEILRGKLHAALYIFSGILAISVIVFGVSFIFVGDAVQVPLLFASATVGVTLLAASAGLLGAALSRGMGSALVLSYLISCAALGLFPAPLLSFSYLCHQPLWIAGPASLSSLVLSCVLALFFYRLSVTVFKASWMRDR